MVAQGLRTLYPSRNYKALAQTHTWTPSMTPTPTPTQMSIII